MRITIEIAEDKVERLRALAEERGEDGYSRIIDELLEAHLDAACRREGMDVAARAEALEGVWGAERAERARSRIAESRASWR